MTEEPNIRRDILEYVEDTQGCKFKDLVFYIAPKYTYSSAYILDRVDDLVREKLLVEVQYSVPQTQGLVKSFLLPKGSLVSLRSMVERHV